MKKLLHDLKVGILYGGSSEEREVSLGSGETVEQAIQSNFSTQLIDPKLEPNWLELYSNSIDIFFIALHGSYGENGEIQRELSQAGKAYTGSSEEACRLTFYKDWAKLRFEQDGIPTPQWMVTPVQVYKDDPTQALLDIKQKFPANCFIKPSNQGSSVGCFRVAGNGVALDSALNQSMQYNSPVIIEKLITGLELSVGILDGEVLPIIGIAPTEQFYSYQAKYNSSDTKYIQQKDLELSDLTLKRIQALAWQAFQSCDCEGWARVDFLMDQDMPLVTEINTVPGMTSHSLIPMAAKQAGYSLRTVIEKIIYQAADKAGLLQTNTNSSSTTPEVS